MRWTLISFYMSMGIVCAVLVSCSSTEFQKLERDVFYKRDLGIKVNGRKYDGVVVIPRAVAYKIELEAYDDINLILWRGCAREDSGTPKKPGFFNFLSSSRIAYTYVPQPGLEDVGTCPLRIETFNASRNQHAWALLEFEHPSYQIPFQLDCNGRRESFDGVGSCQQKAGILMRTHFDQPIMFATPKPTNCPMPKRTSKNIYKWEAGVGECLYHFKNEIGQLGKFTAIGYQGVLIRGGV